jgi:PAS domain S-box-containing protein
MNYIDAFFGRNGLLPHGYCISSAPTLLWTMVFADALIAIAYFSIPLAILRFMRLRADASLRGLAWLFSAFIFACGLTHALDIWTLWLPDYGWLALAKVATAALSVGTAAFTWRLIPHALQIPSVARLRGVIQSLETEIAHRRSAEEQLAEVQQSLAVTLASIGAGFLATDDQGRVTRMNTVAERLLGWTEGQAQGQRLWQVFEREDRPADYLARNPVEVMAEQGDSIDRAHHVMAISRSGLRTPVEVKAALTRAADGSPRGMAVVFRDQTRKVMAEAESARLAAIVESSNDAIIGKTLDGRITSWNRAAQAMFGYTQQEVLGQPVQMLIPPNREIEEMRILGDLASGATVAPFDTFRRRRDGSLVQVSLSISPIRNSRGQVIGASKIARDITAQRQAEAALRESDARLRFTLDAAQIGDWSMNLDTGRIEGSIRHDRCFGYDTLQAGWTGETFLEHVHPEDRAEVNEHVVRAVRALGEYVVDYRVIWPDGSLHWLRSHASVRHEGGVASGLVGIVTDITREKEAEAARLNAQRLEAENRQIQAASRLKSQFLANMSHELRTPLNAIIGFAELLHNGLVPVTSPKHRDYLGHIGTSGRHLLQLINDVLDLSKVESGKFEFFPEPVQLPRVVGEVCNVLGAVAQRKGIELRTELDERVHELVLDPARLKQALYNYLANAIKFTPEGGVVTVRAQPEGELRWRLEVQDNGIGIAPENLGRLFHDFQQLDAGYNKAHQGTGLGLALTRRLVEAQGGSVGVRSTLGEGSVFHLVMDRRQTAGSLGQQVAPAAASHRLLVIQGDENERARLLRAIADAGFIADGAGNGDQALRLAMAQGYQAFTLDLQLPDQRGLELLARIREQGASHSVPVLGVSLASSADEVLNFPIADVLFKPLSTEQVAMALKPFSERSPEPARVMVVDDDPLALSLMHATLAGLGISAICVSGGEQALRDIDQHRPDAIVLDLMMPGFDGFAVLDALQRMPRWRAVPVFVWTSMLLTEDELALLQRSARAILHKGGGGVEPLLDSLRRWRAAGPVPASVSSGQS